MVRCVERALGPPIISPRCPPLKGARDSTDVLLARRPQPENHVEKAGLAGRYREQVSETGAILSRPRFLKSQASVVGSQTCQALPSGTAACTTWPSTRSQRSPEWCFWIREEGRNSKSQTRPRLTLSRLPRMRYFHLWQSRPPIFHGRTRLTCPWLTQDGTWQCRLAERPWNTVRLLRLSWACRRRKTPGEESRHIGSLAFRSRLVTCDRVCSATCVGGDVICRRCHRRVLGPRFPEPPHRATRQRKAGGSVPSSLARQGWSF
jgi:hypothetical protein